MSTHQQEHLDLLFLFALQALPARDITTVESQIAACEECRQELDSLGPIVRSFVGWPTDVLRPSNSAWEQLAKRLAEETGEAMLPAPERWAEPEWEEVAPGIRCKLLATDNEQDRVSMLVRLAPGVAYPAHRHAGVEELHLLSGELWIDERRLVPGDYNRAEPGTADTRVWSETGCTCVLITSTRDALS